jgi:hypothetical protein
VRFELVSGRRNSCPTLAIRISGTRIGVVKVEGFGRGKGRGIAI